MAACSGQTLGEAPQGWHKATLKIFKDKKIVINIEEKYSPVDSGWVCELVVTYSTDPSPDQLSSFTATGSSQNKSIAVSIAASISLAHLLDQFSSQLNFQRAWDARYIVPQANPPADRAIWSLPPRPSWWVDSSSSDVLLWTYLDRYPQDESRRIEFKLNAWNPKVIRDTTAKYACAFLNSEGGSLFFGIRDDGTIIGLIPPLNNPQALDQLLQQLDTDLRSIYPAPNDRNNKLLYTIMINHDPLTAAENLNRAQSAIHHPAYPPVAETMAENAIILQIDVSTGHHPVYFKCTTQVAAAAWKRYDSSVHAMPPAELVERIAQPVNKALDAIRSHCKAILEATASLCYIF